jgi:hypothetical protein
MANFQGKDATFDKPYLNAVSDKIKNKKPIKIVGVGNKTIPITKSVQAFIDAVKSGNITKVNAAMKINGKFAPIFDGHPWTKIDKAPFSGKGGSGGGAEVTALTENMQCYFNSLAFNVLRRELKPTDCTEENLKKSVKWCYTDRTLDKCLSDGPADWMDGLVYMKIANVFYKDYKSRMTGNVYFHRGSMFMKNIYKAKSDCHKIDRASETPQAPGSFSDDKWNPGDIWATTMINSSKPLEKHTQSWTDLNVEVARLAGAKGGKTELIGISLKKSSNPKISHYNKPNGVIDSGAKDRGFIYGKNGDFFSSQDMYYITDKGDVQFRTFGGTRSWQGEIKGKEAAGGKIGGGNVDFYAKMFLAQSVYGKNAKKEFDLLRNVNLKNERFVNEFYTLYRKTIEEQINTTNNDHSIDITKFIKLLQEKGPVFINSKYICVKLADALIESSRAQRDRFSSAIFRYAASNTDQSSYFIKIS